MTPPRQFIAASLVLTPVLYAFVPTALEAAALGNPLILMFPLACPLSWWLGTVGVGMVRELFEELTSR